MNVSIFGDTEIFEINELKDWLNKVIEKMITMGAKNFYLTGYTKFDMLCKSVLDFYKKIHPDVNIVLALPYESTDICLDDYDRVIHFEHKDIFPLYAIKKRNDSVIENSDYVLFYISSDTSKLFLLSKQVEHMKKPAVLFPKIEFFLN